MSGKELWEHIQAEAREAMDVDATWRLGMVDLGNRDGKVTIRLDRGREWVVGEIWVKPEVIA